MMANEDSDQVALLHYTKYGDEMAFEKIVDRHLNLVYQIARSRTGDTESAKEVTQDVFSILARKASSVIGHPSIPAWLHRITIYESINALRKKKKEVSFKDAYSQEQKINSRLTDQMHKKNGLDWSALDKAMESLPERDRQILFLKYYEGRNFKEISQMMAGSHAAIRKRASRALERLRNTLVTKHKGATIAGITAVFLTMGQKSAAAGITTSLVSKVALSSLPAVTSTKIITSAKIIYTMTQIKTISLITGIALIGAAIPVIIQQKRINEYKEQTERYKQASEVSGGSTRPSQRSNSRCSSGGKSGVKNRAGNSALRSSRMQDLGDHYASLTTPDQFKKELEKLSSIPESLRKDMKKLLFTYWAEVDPIAAVDHSMTMAMTEEGWRFSAQQVILQSWSAKAPEEAAQYFIEHYTWFVGPHSYNPLEVIAREWFLHDSEAAFAWAKSSENTATRSIWSSPLPGLIREAARVDPYEAVEMLSSITDVKTRKSAMESLAGEWGRRDWSSAKAWIVGLPENEQLPLLSWGLTRVSEKNPETAATEAAAILPQSKERDKVFSNTIQQWSKRDPAAAAEWLKSSLTDNDELFHDKNTASRGMMTSIMVYWAHNDDSAALEYVSNFPEGHDTLRDEALRGYINCSKAANSQNAMHLAESISSEYERSLAVNQVLGRWLKNNQEEALSYLEKTEHFSQDQKDAYYRKFNQQNPSDTDTP